MNASLPEMLTPGEVASWLHTRTNFVLRLVRRGEIPHVKLPNGDVLFDRAELTDWVKTYRVGKAGQAAESATADTRGARK
jgi:excisionase family DNA binding protein